MNPRINVGKGVTGAVNYVLGEGCDPNPGELLPDPLDGSSRVAWIGGTGFGFNIETEAHAEARAADHGIRRAVGERAGAAGLYAPVFIVAAGRAADAANRWKKPRTTP